MNQRERKIKGQEIEEYVQSLLKDHMPIKRITTNGDYIIGKDIILEVKSSEVCQSAGQIKSMKASVFIINPTAHENLKDCDWYSLVLTFKSQVLLLRFIKASNLKIFQKVKAFHDNLYSIDALSLEQFIETIQEEII